MKYILAIDQGTTGSRAVVYDKKGRVVAGAYKEFAQHFPSPGWVEHDPQEIWKSVNNSIQRVLRKVPARSIAAIGITNQRETTVVWNGETGEPVNNAIVWQCRRTSRRCDALIRKRKKNTIRRITGLPIDAYFSATKIEWILKNVPGAMRMARKGGLCFGTTDSWILWKLTGGKTHATDFTNASRTMVFNIEKKCWDSGLLKLFGIPEGIMPAVKKSSGLFGHTVEVGRLAEGIPVSGIAGDQQAALFGQACFSPGTLKNTYGTGSFVLMNTGRQRKVSRHGLITTLGCGARGEPVYALEGAIFIAGAVVQWLRDGLKIIKSTKETKRMAQSVVDTGGVYFVPAFVGLGAPHWNQDARASITGMTRGTSEAHIVRAALESIAYQTKDVIVAMEKDSGLKIKELKVDGGAVANDFICQFQADMLNVPVVRPKEIESTALGAAYLAGLSVGYWKTSKEIAKQWQVDKVFNPEMDRKEADRLYRGWKRAVKQLVLANRQ